MWKRVKNKILSIILAVFVICTVLSIPCIAESEISAPQKIVHVSCGVNNSLYMDDNGKVAGYLSYYIRQLEYLNNWKMEFVEGSWNESVQNLYDGKIDILFPTQKTDDRLATMAFSEYIGGYQPIALYVKDDAEIYYDDFSSYNGKRIAVSSGTSNAELLEKYAQEHGFTYTAVNMNTIQEKLDALNNGTVDMILFSTLNEVPDSKIVSILDYLPFYYCTRIGDTELMNEINEGMRSIFIQNPNAATTVYGDVLKGSSPISFTKEENELIKNADKIRVGMYDDSLPLAGKDSDGKSVGIYIDLLKEIENKSGITIEPVLIPRNRLLYSCLIDGTADFVIGSKNLAYNEDDVSHYMCSESVMDYITVAITRSDYTFDDAPEFILTHPRKYWESEIYKLYPNAKVKYCDNVKECFAAVQSGRADATLINTWEYNYQSKNARFSTMMEWESLRKKTELVLGVKKGTDLTLMSIIEKSIDQVAGQDKDSIVASNLNMAYNSYDIADYWYSIKNIVLAVVIVMLFLLTAFCLYWHIRKQHTKELEDKNYQLEKSNEAKDVFLSRMSHELRTPLNAINGYASVIQQNIAEHKYDEEKTMSYTESILRAGKYQLAIIGDLLDIQKIESGKIELVPIEVDSSEYMKNIVAMITPEANEKGVEFVYERINNINDTYLLDGVRFEQVLLNILHNAVKFTPAGGKVKLTAEVVDHNETTNILKFTISDTGIGMSEDFRQNYLFHRFAQEYKGNTSPYEGCGTGLAISREIMHLMGGEITCESKQGVGSTFTVVLTAKHLERKRKQRKRKVYPSYDLSGIKVLLCEDNKMNQDIEKRILEKMKCSVDIADDGQIGVDMFCKSEEGNYDVILMDIRMPNMDGLEATEAIRASERSDAKTVTIMAVSANSFDEDVKKSLAAGMNEHLAKPVDARILYEKISQYCKHSDTADNQLQ